MPKRSGRPVSSNPKQCVLGVRVTESDHEMIRLYAESHQQTISQVVLSGIKMLINQEDPDKE